MVTKFVSSWASASLLVPAIQAPVATATAAAVITSFFIEKPP
ncbi:MAG: hypothetical protein U5L06_05045 [Rhodovibrio sp.]|nr:hypothetical protein [Rhodovibrio sp.]